MPVHKMFDDCVIRFASLRGIDPKIRIYFSICANELMLFGLLIG